MKSISIGKIRQQDLKGRKPFWKFSRFKRVHKSKKTYTRKNKHKNSDG